jgi:hypothetical protein
VSVAAVPPPERQGLGDRLRGLLNPGRAAGLGGPGRGPSEPPAREEV